MELADRMRSQNHEQFETLVRMHLSFELDLNTDDNGVVLNEKGKFRKRFQFHKKAKPPIHTSKTGSPVLGKECVGQLRNIMEFLMMDQNVIQEGIFRRTGSVARQNELKTKVNDGTGAPLSLENGTYTVHDCASVLKGVLADLPEPLLTDTYGPAHQQMAELCNNIGSPTQTKSTRLLHSLQLLILLLPLVNRMLLKEIIEMLHETIKYESSNKMSADSLATLFTPHLICPKKLTPEALHATSQNLSGIISFMITKGSEIFDIPPKLATDIRAYFVEQKRKQTLSPEQILDESVTSDSTANTVYTFIDRERTAQAHVQNPTDTCLAQLYAYIQSLPESSKKRKLIKQFNKENGQGTPLQVQKMHRLKNGNSVTKSNTKSLGDSIKRHIFQKNLMSRTPKPAVPSFHHTTPSHTQTSAATGAAAGSSVTGAFDTPNRTHPTQLLTLKSRVLFQSPASTPNKSATALVPSTPAASNTSSAHTPSATPVASTSCASQASSNTTAEDDDDALASNEFEMLSETITKLQNASQLPSNAKKSVGFAHDTFDDDDDAENRCPSDMRSRHKSEPNLTNLLADSNRCLDMPPGTPTESIHRIGGTGGRYIANKLLKGVSMVNLVLPVSSPSIRKSTSTLFQSSELVDTADGVETPIKKVSPNRHMDDGDIGLLTPVGRAHPVDDFDEDIDDPDFVATPNSQRTSRGNCEHDDFADSFHTPMLERNEPQFMLGRKSMSPITKSTQRMSKAMQESIMTPRSRKPVMLNGALFAGLTDQTNHQNSFSSLREEDEDELAAEYDYAMSGLTEQLPGSPSLYKSKSEGDFGDLMDESNPRGSANRRLSIKHPSEASGLSLIGTGAPLQTTDTLSSTFRNYLFSRSVISASPVDSSFSSHPDDFGSAPDLTNIMESDLSESLLYCLDGNQPTDVATADAAVADSVPPAVVDRPSTTASRKRTNGGVEGAEAAEMQQYFDELHPKKIAVALGVPGETSL